MKQPKMIQETLIDDEDLSADIADLVPVSSKITDAAATYIGKVSKKFGDETIAGDKLRILNKTSELAQEVVKAGAAINRLLRNPRQAMAELVEAEVKQRELERLAARPPKHRRSHSTQPTFPWDPVPCLTGVSICRVAGHAGRSAGPPDWTRRSPAAPGMRTNTRTIRRRGIPPTPRSS